MSQQIHTMIPTYTIYTSHRKKSRLENEEKNFYGLKKKTFFIHFSHSQKNEDDIKRGKF